MMTALPIETGKQRSRIRTLDGVRGLAAIGVMLYHFGSQLQPAGALTAALKWVMMTGPRLELFFVLSGFLVTGLLYDAKERSDYYRNFYTRRMLRILPLYYGALTLLFLVPYILPAGAAANFRVPVDDQLWYWFYLQNFRPLPPQFVGLAWHFWSLAIEQQFYLVWPIVILKASRQTALRVSGGLIVTSILYRAFGPDGGAAQGLIWPTPARLDGIAVGSALALIMRGPEGLAPVRRRLRAIFIASVAVITANIALDHFGLSRGAITPFYFTFTGLFFGSLLVYAIHAGTGRGASLMRSPALAFFGKYGYGLYVFHVPMVALAWKAGLKPEAFAWTHFELAGALLYIVSLIALSTAAALVSWHMWEKQFLKLKRKPAHGGATAVPAFASSPD